MSLAGSQRGLSVISSIKCSACGKAISLLSLADHICDASIDATPAPPARNPFSLDHLPRYDPVIQAGPYGYGNKNLPGLPTPPIDKWNSKPIPPRINPDFANNLFPDTPPYSASGSSDASSRDGRSGTPLTPSTSITSPAFSYFNRAKASRTPSPTYTQNLSSSPTNMGPSTMSERAPPVPSKQGPDVFQRINAGVAGPFAKAVPARRLPGPGLPSSPKSSVDRKPKTSVSSTSSIPDIRPSSSQRRTPSPVNDTLLALSGRRPSVDQYQEEKKHEYKSSWDKPLPDPSSAFKHKRQESTHSHRREDSNKSVAPNFSSEYTPWWLKDSQTEPIKQDKTETETAKSWDRPLPPLKAPLQAIDESPPSRPKTANPETDTSRKERLEQGFDPAIQFGLDDSSLSRYNQNHLHSSSDPEPWKSEAQPAVSHTHTYNHSHDNPFSSSYSSSNPSEFNHRQRNYNNHSHQYSDQSLAFSSSSSHNLVASPTSSSASPERRQHNWSSSGNPRTLGSTSSSAAKHTCRGCSHVITGRSLVDSSRRLTGRYHKECFVCTDCRAPFPSGDFYVLENLPYCAYDYHRRNKSLCTGCGVGVEGSYLQTGGEDDSGNVKAEEAKLWHLECFKCGGCGCVLRGEYWEMDGKALCTRDAFPNGFGFGRQDDIKEEDDEGRDGIGAMASSAGRLGVSPADGQRNPERRRTKLFMGGMFGSAPIAEPQAQLSGNDSGYGSGNVTLNASPLFLGVGNDYGNNSFGGRIAPPRRF